MSATSSNFKPFRFLNGLSGRLLSREDAQGKYLVFLPGGPGISGKYLDEIAAKFTTDFRVNIFIFNLPFHDDAEISVNRDFPKDLDFQGAVGLIQDAIQNELKPNSCVFVGHSFGALLTCSILCSGKPFFKGGYLVSMPVSGESSAQFKIEKKRLGLLEPTISSEEDFGRYWKSILGLYARRNLSPREVANLTDETFWEISQSLWVNVVWPDPRSLSVLGSIPLGIMQGLSDLRLPDNNLERLKELAPLGGLDLLEEVGHFPMLEVPDVFLARVKKFVVDQKLFA
jgi:pimeloyl-ACP methyl ester carboxylesterase